MLQPLKPDYLCTHTEEQHKILECTLIVAWTIMICLIYMHTLALRPKPSCLCVYVMQITRSHAITTIKVHKTFGKCIFMQ